MIEDGDEVTNSGLTAQFRKPPSQAHEQEAPVFEEFRWFAFEGVADELQNPAADKHRYQRLPPSWIDD